MGFVRQLLNLVWKTFGSVFHIDTTRGSAVVSNLRTLVELQEIVESIKISKIAASMPTSTGPVDLRLSLAMLCESEGPYYA